MPEISIKNVEKFWSSHPCQSTLSSKLVRKEYFEDIEYKRYKSHRYLKTVAEFDKFRGMKVLEIGCGIGTDGRKFVDNGAIYTGINLDKGSTELAIEAFDIFKLDGVIIQMNAENLKFSDSTFNHVYSMGVIHHSINTEKIVREIFRVLKPNGTINIMIYNKSSVNYYFEIMFLRKVFRYFLIPSFSPKLISKLLKFDKYKLKKHREIMLSGKKITKEEWISMNTDGTDCPLAKVYSKNDTYKLFSTVGFVNIKQYVRYFKKSHYSFFGKLLPDFMADSIGKVFGWHRWVKASKPKIKKLNENKVKIKS